MENIVFHGDDGAPYSATGRDLVPGFEFVDHRLPAFLTRRLRTKQHEIHHPYQEGHHDEKRPETGTGSGLEQIQIKHVMNHLGCL